MEICSGQFFVVCTLEGSLVLSMSEAVCIVLVAYSKALQTRIIRAPIFIFNNLEESTKFQNWVNKNLKKIKTAAESTTNHGSILLINILYKIM